MLTMQEQREMNEMFEQRPWARMETTVVAFDPHALAMALQLADEIEVEADCAILWRDEKPLLQLAYWLRAEVRKELESQP